ncbi:hypothetical protein [Streptomyces macrosporus]|uniref:Uncharacterized protein n=1 Tax=Streptomyces macrosporus TaxID=44032 RepID=A0ABN3KEA5_9ACTN
MTDRPARQCGPECSEGHLYAYRCALKPPPVSPWKILGVGAEPEPAVPATADDDRHRAEEQRADHNNLVASMRTFRVNANRYRAAWHNARNRARDERAARAAVALRLGQAADASAQRAEKAETEVKWLAPALADAYAALDRVRALHREEDGICLECTTDLAVRWPCPTIRALDPQ